MQNDKWSDRMGEQAKGRTQETARMHENPSRAKNQNPPNKTILTI